jgi:hypothetical protein
MPTAWGVNRFEKGAVTLIQIFFRGHGLVVERLTERVTAT